VREIENGNGKLKIELPVRALPLLNRDAVALNRSSAALNRRVATFALELARFRSEAEKEP